jgi:hypothetical protein
MVPSPESTASQRNTLRRPLLSARYPELVEESTAGRESRHCRGLIFRQAQDDRKLRRDFRKGLNALSGRAQRAGGGQIISKYSRAPFALLFVLLSTSVCFAQVQGIPPNQPATSADQLDDIRPPFFHLHSWFWWWVALAVLIVVALLIFAWFRLRPRPGLLSPKSAYELTLEKLDQARALLREDQAMPYAVLVSETVRSYLGQRFQTPSTRRTTEEFLRQMEADRTTPLAEHRELLHEFLQSCDLVKFARYQPTLLELEHVQQRAVSFVEATKPVPASVHQNGSSSP